MEKENCTRHKSRKWKELEESAEGGSPKETHEKDQRKVAKKFCNISSGDDGRDDERLCLTIHRGENLR